MKKETKYNWKKHLFRASSFGMLMSDAKELTVKQKETLIGLQEKAELTEKQQATLDDLIMKRDRVELSKGAKTYLRKLRREVKFNRRIPLESKYLDKGIKLEEDAITFLSIYHDEVFTNNKERRTDKFFSGEMDVTEGFDTKVSFWMDSLPDPEEKLKIIYEFQDRVYMILWDLDQCTTSAIVMSHDKESLKDMIYKEAFKPKWKEKDEYGDEIGVPDWRKVEMIKLYTFEEKGFYELCTELNLTPNEESEEKHIDMFMSFVEIPEHERIVEKTVYRDKGIEKKMKQIVVLSREYLQELEDDMWSKRIIK